MELRNLRLYVIQSQNGMITERICLSKIIDLLFSLKHEKVLSYAEIITGRIIKGDWRDGNFENILIAIDFANENDIWVILR